MMVWCASSRLYRNPFPAEGRPFDLRRLGHVRRHSFADTAEQLDTLGNRVYQFDLLVEVLIEEQMQLIERRSGDLPVRLLIQVAESHGIG